MRARFYCRENGFSFLEMLTTLAVVAILAGIAVPGFANFGHQQQRASATEQLVSLLALTRSTAVKTGKIAWLCGSQDGSNCQKSDISSFILFVDANNNHRADADELIANTSIPSPELRYQISPSTMNSFRFRPDGTASSYGNVITCPANRDNRYAAKIIVSNMGRVRHALDHNHDGIVDDQNGKPLACP